MTPFTTETMTPNLKFGKQWNPNGILKKNHPLPIFSTPFGVLFRGDCLEILPQIESDTVDTVFADPPFNIGKKYGPKVNDNLPESEYVQWCHSWLKECIRILKPGGSLFVYNIPKWNILLGSFLMGQGLQFRDWVAVNIKLGLPISGRLYPSHYGLLYFSKGKPKTFHNIRTPILRCRHCAGEIKDYGGHRNAMNPKGVNLTDVWDDIPPVRHWKFKSKKRNANQLSTKMLQRILEISTVPGNLVVDPFGGSGTTYDVCENLGRNWIGMEIENPDVIIERLENGCVGHHQVTDYVERKPKR